MAVQIIGRHKQTDKLVFVALTPNFLSLRDQCAHWSWQSPGPMEPGNDFHQKRNNSHSVGQLSIHFLSNRGIATPVCALVRNDSKYSTNTNLQRKDNPLPPVGEREEGYAR